MIVQICTLTTMTKADLFSMCGNHSIRFYSNIRHNFIRYDGDALPASPAYFGSLRDFNYFQEKLQESEERFLVLLGHAFTMLSDEDDELVPIARATVKNVAGLIQLATRAAKKPAITVKIKMGLNSASVGLAELAMGNSVMHKVQTSLYRIPKPLRGDVQKSVFAYLSGHNAALGKASQYPHILAMLAAPEMQNLRRACKSIALTGISNAVTHFKVDAFDLNFLLAQEKKDLPVVVKLKANARVPPTI